MSALTHSGDKTFCWIYKDGRSQRTEIQTGRKRRSMDRGHQSASRRSASGLDSPWSRHRYRKGDSRRPVDSGRWRPRGGHPVPRKPRKPRVNPLPLVLIRRLSNRLTWPAHPEAAPNGYPSFLAAWSWLLAVPKPGRILHVHSRARQRRRDDAVAGRVGVTGRVDHSDFRGGLAVRSLTNGIGEYESLILNNSQSR